jgi:hypothetical protein
MANKWVESSFYEEMIVKGLYHSYGWAKKKIEFIPLEEVKQNTVKD